MNTAITTTPAAHAEPQARSSTRAPLRHAARRDEHRQILVDRPNAGDLTRTASYGDHVVEIGNGRARAAQFDLDGAGFAFGRYPTRVSDFGDDADIRNNLYPQIESLLAWITGAERLITFDHTVRTSQGPGAGGARHAVHVAHNDYTERSGPERAAGILEQHVPGASLTEAFAIVNAWRPIERPVERDPLAMLDARSVQPGDLRPTELVYPDRRGEIHELAHGAQHRWFWFPRMRPDELLLFKQYDSRPGRARFTPHGAFADPDTRAEAPPRRSIELRILLLLPDGGLD